MLYQKRHNFRLIPDWEKQFSVWFSWPVRSDIWTESLDLIKIQLVKLYQTCSKFQKVCVICPNREKNTLISKLKDYGDMKNIELYNYETDDIWIRDYGPIFLKSNKDNSLLMTNWKFNAWGGKFENYSKDDSFNDWFSKVIGVEKNESKVLY